MRILAVTNLYPSHERPHWGNFVRVQVESLRELGLEVSVHHIDGARSTLEYARALAFLPKLASTGSFDVVHAHYGLSGLAAVRVRGTPLVVTYCGDDLLGRSDGKGSTTRRSRFLTRFAKAVAWRADAVIVMSEEMRRLVPRARRIELIPYAIDTKVFMPRARAEARRELGWDAETKILLFAASPDEPVKNWPLAREVEAALVRRGHRVRLIAVHGRPQREVATAMNAADVLLVPSFQEGSPNVVKEAMAVNLPVVATPVGDCPDCLRGCVPSAVAPANTEEFARAVERILADGRRSNGRTLVAAYEPSRVAVRVAGLYGELVRTRSGVSGRRDAAPFIPA